MPRKDHHWDKAQRPSWQQHSERGPNIAPEEKNDAKPPLTFEELVNPMQPPEGKEYDCHWTRRNYDQARVYARWQQLRESHSEAYTDDALTRDTLNDDYQQLFVSMLLDHVQHVLVCLQNRTQPEPLRLLLLGTAGSGKTRAVQTALQEIQRTLAKAGLSFDLDPREFVRVAAPTGSAAFNLRFHATTVHRLIHWFTPPYFKLISDDKTLYDFQKQLRNTQLIILDEISMIGRQMMGRIDSRMEQAKGYQDQRNESIGGLSCVAVGDPAQCEAMHDQQIYNTAPHKGTA